jgi:glycosyltransferase involved in cell wall biosynthesis
MSLPKVISDELVSVVIPCFNQGKYLGEAIQSVLVQTHARTEIVIVDDGSTDTTAAVAHSYPQAIYLYQHNQGLAMARNAGLRASTGDYVTFLDSDDRFLPKAVEAGLNCLSKHPECGFVFGRYRNIDADGKVISPPNQPPDESDFYSALLQRNLIGMPAAVMYPRSVLDRVRGFQGQLRRCEDYDLYLRIAREFSIHKHDEIVAEYRRHGEQMSRNYRRMLDTTLQILQTQAPFASRDPRLESAIKAGVSNWHNYYGLLMLQDFREYARMQGLDRGYLQRLRNLLRCYPQGIGSMARSALRGLIYRLPPLRPS